MARPRSRGTDPDKKERDWYDITTLVVQTIGVILIVYTIAITLRNNASTGRDMANAIGQMSAISNSVAAEQREVGNETEATRNVAKATGNVATATERSLKTARDQADTASKQLVQNHDMLATQIQPIVDIDPSRSDSDFGSADGIYGWNYWFKNSGQTAARNLKIQESLSVFGSPFQTRIRTGQPFLGPGGIGASTAQYIPSPGEFDTKRAIGPMLRVTFTYTDQFGRRLHNSFCRTLPPFGNSVLVC